MPKSTKPGWIDWVKSRSRDIILDDLIAGIIPHDPDECSPEFAWNTWYCFIPEIIEEKVTYEQFQKQFKAHQLQITKKKKQSNREEAAYRRHVDMYPRRTHNSRGEPVFDVHEAKDLLREDVRVGKHKQLTPIELRNSRPEYQDFKLKIFCQRIYQEVRRHKFVHTLELKRAEKLRKQRATRSEAIAKQDAEMEALGLDADSDEDAEINRLARDNDGDVDVEMNTNN